MSNSDDIRDWDIRLTEQAKRGWDNYIRRRIHLDVARSNEIWNICGEFIYIEEVSSAIAVGSIRLNRDRNDAIDLELGTIIKTMFTQVYITHAALADEWIDIIIGINFEYEKAPAITLPVPVPVTDNGGSLTVDGTVAVSAVGGAVIVVDGGGSITVDGTFWQATQPVSAAALPLPAGAATAAKQLADGHNVTVDNAGGGAAVNVQDGGNSITVDGVVTAVDNGVAQECIIITHANPDTNQAGANNACKRVLIRAHTTNTGLVWVNFGAAAVDGSDYPLDKGDAVSVPLANTNQVNCLFKVGGEKVTVVYTN